MHDPMTLIYGCRFFDLWHVDPEKDGTDDSCGWFKRARHGNPTVLEAIRKGLASEWDGEYSGWFNKDGSPRYSTVAITLQMFRRAAYNYFGRSWTKTNRFMQRNLFEILAFAENPIDSLHDFITNKYGVEDRERRIDQMASILYGWIIRAEQPWYRHPRWHIWHWKLNIHSIQNLKRWLFSRCAHCGKRFGWGYAPVSHSWDNDGPRWLRSEKGVFHHECSHHAMAAANAPGMLEAE